MKFEDVYKQVEGIVKRCYKDYYLHLWEYADWRQEGMLAVSYTHLEWKDVNFDDAQDGLYNKEKAKAEFAKAKKALQEEGVEFPIHLDMPVDQTASAKVQRVQSLKQSIESSLGTDNVVVDIHQMKTDDVLNITYYAASAAEEDWDISDNVGWSPDYQDPSTYLEIIKPGGENTCLLYTSRCV